ncbi:MAG: NmrA family NAD(P)-binding protein [Rubricoccaceae bacterium]
MSRIVVSGATGTVGGAVLRALLADGHEAVAAVRQPDAVALSGDAEVVAFDFMDAATFRPALEGADGLFLMRPPAISNTKRYINPVVEAAEDTDVQRVAFLSVLGAGRNPLLPHRATERRLEDSELDVALLRAAYFMQNFSEVHAREIAKGVLPVPAGDGKTSFIDARDVADVAAAWLVDDTAGLDILELTGPEALDMFEVARILSDVTGHRVDYRRPGLAQFVRSRIDAGDDTSFALVMGAIYSATRLGLADRVTDTVETVLGRPPRSFREFAQDYREAWA